MISTQSLTAFTPSIGRAEPPRPVPPVQQAAAAVNEPQRTLEAVPARPAGPTPRGSLLDLRV